MNALGTMISIFAYLGVIVSLTPGVSSFACTSKTQPAAQYTSLFAPCTFTFFQAPLVAMNVDDYTCTLLSSPEQYDKQSELEQSVFFWPDQCVGNEPRCYDYVRDFSMLNFSTFDMNIPNGTTHIRLECLEDHEQATQLYDDVGTQVTDVVNSAVFVGEVFAIAVLLLIVSSIGACIYCCCFQGRGSSSSNHSANQSTRTYELPGMEQSSGKMTPMPVMAVGKVIT